MEDHEIELKLYELMSELQKVSIDIENTMNPYIDVIEEASKKMDEVSEPLSVKSVEIQEKIKELTLLRAKSLKSGFGSITYRKGGVRRKWDLDKLDLVCKDDIYVKDQIWNFRKEEKFEPQVLIKIEKDGKSVSDL